MSRLTSPTHVKRFLLDTARKQRTHTFKRVSQETLDKIESAARLAALHIIQTAPSKGVTL